jgi:hypothetical protein
VSGTTGPILAVGAITVTNRTVFNGKEMDWRPVVATGLAAVAFMGAERLWPQGARMLAWTALAAVCLTRLEPDVPSPVESALAWWEQPARPRPSGARTASV